MIKLILKILSIPVLVVLTLLECLGTFLVFMVELPFYIIAKFFFFIAACYFIGRLGSIWDAWFPLLLSAIVFVLPYVIAKIVVVIAKWKYMVKAFLFS